MQQKLCNASWIQHAEVLALCLFIWTTFSSSDSHKRSIKHIYNNSLAGSKNNPRTKCTFGVNQNDFPGYRVNQQGMFPLLEKVDAICLFSRPTTVKQPQECFGVVNFYHRFLPSAVTCPALVRNCAAIVQSLCILSVR